MKNFWNTLIRKKENVSEDPARELIALQYKVARLLLTMDSAKREFMRLIRRGSTKRITLSELEDARERLEASRSSLKAAGVEANELFDKFKKITIDRIEKNRELMDKLLTIAQTDFENIPTNAA